MQYSFTTSAELRKLMRVSASWLYVRRQCGDWQKGIHWTYLNPETPRSGIRYNTQLCMNWLTCKGTQAHQNAIEDYLKTLTPDQRSKAANQ